jgi:hypothetical protein
LRRSRRKQRDAARTPPAQNRSRRAEKLETRLRQNRKSFHFTNTRFARSPAPPSGKFRIHDSPDGGFFARCENNLIENALYVTFFVDECIAEAQ